MRECLAEWKIDERDAADVLEAYSSTSDYRNRQKAGQLMGKLDHEVRRQRAERARIQFVNAEVLDSLYLTDAVQAKLKVVRDLLGGFSVDLVFLGEESPKVPLMEQRRAIGEAAEAAHNTMRQELKRGDAAAMLGPLAMPTGSAVATREPVPNDLAGL